MIIPALICGGDHVITVGSIRYAVNLFSNTLYPLGVIEAATRAGLYNGVEVGRGHYTSDIIGKVAGVFWSDAAPGVMAFLDIPGHDDAVSLLREKPGVSGFYHNSETVVSDDYLVTVWKIDRVSRVDIVKHAGMGGRILSAKEAIRITEADDLAGKVHKRLCELFNQTYVKRSNDNGTRFTERYRI